MRRSAAVARTSEDCTPLPVSEFVDVPSSDVWTKGYERSKVQKDVDTTNEQLEELSKQATAILRG